MALNRFGGYVPGGTHPPAPSYGGGFGSPEGVVVGSPFQTWYDEGTNTLYIKESGVGTDTGWVAVGGGGGQLAPEFVVLTDGATITQTMDDTKVVQNATVTLGGNRTLAFSGLEAGMHGRLIVKQPASGGPWGLTLPATSKVVDGGAGVVDLTDTASAIDALSWVYDGTNIIWAYGLNVT